MYRSSAVAMLVAISICGACSRSDVPIPINGPDVRNPRFNPRVSCSSAGGYLYAATKSAVYSYEWPYTCAPQMLAIRNVAALAVSANARLFVDQQVKDGTRILVYRTPLRSGATPILRRTFAQKTADFALDGSANLFFAGSKRKVASVWAIAPPYTGALETLPKSECRTTAIGTMSVSPRGDVFVAAFGCGVLWYHRASNRLNSYSTASISEPGEGGVATALDTHQNLFVAWTFRLAEYKAGGYLDPPIHKTGNVAGSFGVWIAQLGVTSTGDALGIGGFETWLWNTRGRKVDDFDNGMWGDATAIAVDGHDALLRGNGYSYTDDPSGVLVVTPPYKGVKPRVIALPDKGVPIALTWAR